MRNVEYIIIENEKIGQIKAKLLLNKNPLTCEAIIEKLPFGVNLSRWGEELYGEIPVETGYRTWCKQNPLFHFQ